MSFRFHFPIFMLFSVLPNICEHKISNSGRGELKSTFVCFRSRFSTSRQTLLSLPDTFFTALLSGRISSTRDDSGAIFIDRDPTLFGIILNYLRTRDIDIKQCDLRILRHEAEYYNISPLVKRLILCEDLNHSSCGDVWFYAHLTPPSMYSTLSQCPYER